MCYTTPPPALFLPRGKGELFAHFLNFPRPNPVRASSRRWKTMLALGAALSLALPGDPMFFLAQPINFLLTNR
jgi:hypothetical protein